MKVSWETIIKLIVCKPIKLTKIIFNKILYLLEKKKKTGENKGLLLDFNYPKGL